eukprot:TRINITY_DN105467_c0_g1_i1.p1 TRINITY_DN105467_c0_g1~~TRINITY_DN105467_c0_g1_i1.p1  ORF type:complete len:1485 (-),score=426.76 TRINITY_DN105467_c0_g1_i1:23-4477(-)
MLAFEEKPRSVMLLMPELVFEGASQQIVNKLEEAYIEVKARKEVFLNDADAEHYFHCMQPEARQLAVERAGCGLCEVLVLEHLDGDIVERTLAMAPAWEETFGTGSFFLSQDEWECKRDLEFFFPYLDNMSVERTLVVIKPPAVERGAMDGRTIEQTLEAEVAAVGLFVVGKRHAQLTPDQAKAICHEYDGSADHSGAIGVLTQAAGCIVMCLEGRGAIGKLQLICGPLNSGVARRRAPSTIRAVWGTDSTDNGVHTSLNMEYAEKELKALFPAGTLKLQRTLAIIKPDAYAHLVAIKAEIEAAGFTVLKEKITSLTEARAAEFFSECKDKPFFDSIVKEASSGPCCAMVLCRLEAIAVWNQLMGCASVKEARRLQPGSLRARFGRDGQRNAVHGSESARAAGREIRFFFPDMGIDPLPDDSEVRDFLYRKSVCESMDLKSLSDADTSDFTVDPTMQQLLSDGLVSLCDVQPEGLGAVNWLADWLEQHNPNQPAWKAMFDPPARPKQFLDYGVTQDGMPFAVEAPDIVPAAKPIVEIDAAAVEKEATLDDMPTPPFVVFVGGGPGSGKGTQCTKIAKEFNMIHLSTGDLMRAEVAAETILGQEILEHMKAGSLVPDDAVLTMLKKAMVKHQDTNRFLLDGFPRSVEQAKRFEREIAEMSFLLLLDVREDVMRERIAGRAVSEPGRPDDNEETLQKRLVVYAEQTMPLVSYYNPIGKLRKVDAEKSVEEVFSDCKRYFSCRFTYLLGPPGAPITDMAEKLEMKYGHAAIDLSLLLKAYAKSNEPDAEKVQKALAEGKAVDASIACPLLISEIYRDMALGVQNFTLCNFPQSLKQVQFLEYRIPCLSRALVLDFTRADTSDLVAAAATRGEDMLDLVTRARSYFGSENKEVLTAINAERLPCNLSEMENSRLKGLDFNQKVIEGTWKILQPKVMPAISIVLGLPGSGTTVLATVLAKKSPNSQMVDCSRMLDAELDRQSQIGLTMSSMLARGQVVPMSMTIELLKGVINLTSSDGLILQNCPVYADQIEIIEQDFRIDKVYYIEGSEDAIASWGAMFSASEDSKLFHEQQARLPAIVAHFSRIGKLQKLEVSAAPQEAEAEQMLEKAMMPKFAIVSSLSPVIGGKQTELLGEVYGVSQVVTKGFLQEWASAMLKTTLDDSQPDQFITALKAYATSCSLPLLILQDCPSNEAEAQAFLEAFGQPKVVLSVQCEDEFLDEEYKGLHPDEDVDPEQFTAKLAENRAALDGMVKVFRESSAGSCIEVSRTAMGTPEGLSEMVRQKLRPSVFLVQSPSGLASRIGDKICTSSSTRGEQDSLPAKYTVLDAKELCKPGKHSLKVEDALAKASILAEAEDCLPVNVWLDLLAEAFAKSANPMGVFLLTNFPTRSSVECGEAIRDQLSMIESIAHLAGFIHVELSDTSLEQLCPGDDWASYKNFDAKVYNQLLKQYEKSQILDSLVEDGKSPDEVAAKVAADFYSFQATMATQS